MRDVRVLILSPIAGERGQGWGREVGEGGGGGAGSSPSERPPEFYIRVKWCTKTSNSKGQVSLPPSLPHSLPHSLPLSLSLSLSLPSSLSLSFSLSLSSLSPSFPPSPSLTSSLFLFPSLAHSCLSSLPTPFPHVETSLSQVSGYHRRIDWHETLNPAEPQRLCSSIHTHLRNCSVRVSPLLTFLLQATYTVSIQVGCFYIRKT